MSFKNYQKFPKNEHPKYYPDFLYLIPGKTNPKKSRNKHSLQKVHDKKLEEIANNTSLIGIFGNCISKIEIDLFNENEKIGQVDLILKIPKQNTVYYIEYKCRDLETNREKAQNQLNKAQKFVAEKHKGNIERLLYVHGNFTTEELKNNEWIPFNNTPVK